MDYIIACVTGTGLFARAKEEISRTREGRKVEEASSPKNVEPKYMPKIYSYIIADKTKFYQIKQKTNHFWEELCPVTKFYQIRQTSGKLQDILNNVSIIRSLQGRLIW